VSQYIEVMTTEELAEGEMRLVEVDGHKIVVARIDGAFYAADAHCPHLHGNLWKGTLEGTVVTCPLHHSKFDLTDGHVVTWTDFKGAVRTMAGMVRHARPLRVYETIVDGGDLYVGPQKEPPA